MCDDNDAMYDDDDDGWYPPCSLCLPFERTTPGSNENILAIGHEGRFRHAVAVYRDRRWERHHLFRERDRRRRLGLLPIPARCVVCLQPCWHDKDMYCPRHGEQKRREWMREWERQQRDASA